MKYYLEEDAYTRENYKNIEYSIYELLVDLMVTVLLRNLYLAYYILLVLRSLKTVVLLQICVEKITKAANCCVPY